MSQPRNASDTQALLQSMLQKLKLQPGKEGQVYLNTPVSNPAALTWGQHRENGASDLQGVNSSPANGFDFRTNGLPTREFGIPATETQKSGHVGEVDSHLISFPTQKENTDRETGELRVMGPNTDIPKETEQLFPSFSLKDVGISSSERTGVDKDDAVTTGQSFTPRVYTWSMKPADGNIDTGSQVDKVLHMRNGEFGSNDLQVASSGKTNSLSRRQQGTTGNKTRRWTQKIKAKWRDRQGSFGKKGKEEEGGNNQKREQGNGLMTAETLINTSNTGEGRMPPSLDSFNPSETPPAHTEDGNNEGYTRSAGDFEFGLGSFSLLEEIVTGQEWAKFLNPNLPTPSTNQRPSEELLIPQNPLDTVNLKQHGAGSNQWSFVGTEATPGSDVSMTQTLPDVFLPVSMDVSGGRQQQDVHRETGQPEPMEHVNNQSDMQSEESGQQQRPTSFLRPLDLLDNSALKSRVQLNRKRQHQSAGRRDYRLRTEETSAGEATDREESSMTVNSEMTKETGEASQHDALPLYILNSSQPLSPSSSVPPKGVLKHSISRDSESSMEVETKRRRVEGNRHVHFSEEVLTIPLPEMDLDVSDSEEEDSGAEDDSVIDQEYEVEPAVMEEVAPARRPALPAWIRALKRKNTGRKHR
ncbi:uncharacterized protein zgc:113229 [Notolabrus celidotus]|uniref:uncharacterized protein zgc:113229 n=1 Tax=Notolabrus celidotus TaxID=1203425 RepID=UPI00148F5C7D|nr:uncharacterized protein zgc:113229 [Notolabrus celidotus]